MIPLAERLVGKHEWIFAGRATAVVPQAATALVRSILELRRVRVIPDLDLWHAAQVDARVSERHGSVVHEQLEIAELLNRGGVLALPVIHEFRAVRAPVSLHVGGPLGVASGAFGVRQREPAAVVERIAAPPA
jgi:hypothetical protein